MGSKGSTTTKSSQALPKEFLAAYNTSLKMAGDAVKTPYQAYQGQLVAGLTPTQQQGIANVNAAQGMALPAIQRGIDLTGLAAQGITPELYDRFYSPYVRDVANSTQANMMESNAQQLSGLKGGAIQAGAFGGDRGGIAAAELARQQNLALGQTMSGIYNQGYGQAMQLAGQQAQNYGAMGQQMAGLGVGAQGSVLQGAQAQLAAGAQEQATGQAQLDAMYQQYMQRLAYPYQQAQFYANVAQGLGSTAGGTSSTTTPGPSWGSQILGGIGAIGSIFSDERVKENIEPVGKLNDGQTIYRYNYKGDPTTQIGLIAQEVEQHHPRAVTEIEGIKGVDYRDATDDAASMSRSGLAKGGGVGGVPWSEAAGWVPTGEMNSAGSGRYPKEPDAFQDKGLAEDWEKMMPLSKEQVGGLKAMMEKMGLAPLDTEVKLGQSPDAKVDNGNARGGLARARYAPGGLAPEDEAQTVEPDGLAAAEPSKGLSRFFASEENPSLIEKVMGRRMSPEARNALMTASFALLAGRSPYMGVNIGEAGKVGMQTYYNALNTKRELTKQQAELGLRGYEAETGRRSVEVQDAGQRRQLAAFIVPMIQTYLATNQPVPPQLMRMLNDAYPPGTPERADIENQMDTGVQAAPLGDVAPTAPAVPEVPDAGGPTPIPQPDNTEAVVPTSPNVPASPDVAAGGEDALKALYKGVPDALNPYYWDERARIADAAGKPDIADGYRDKAAEQRAKDQERGYVMVPGKGRVPYPGRMEQKTAEIQNEEQAKIAVKATDEQTARAFDNIKTVQAAANTLDGAANALKTTETGRFADAKSYAVTALKSLGLEADAALLQQAEGTQKLNKVFSQILFSGGLKDKIGSQIAATELEMFSKGFGDVNLEPGANRYIVGVMRGMLNMESQRSQDWLAFVEKNGNRPMSRADIAKWEAEWNRQNPASQFVNQGIATTPVAGEVDWARFGTDAEYQKAWAAKFKPGYQYVMPDGVVKTYTGRREDQYFVPVGQ